MNIISVKESPKYKDKAFQYFQSKWAITLGSKSFRIGVIEDNHKGKEFWSDLGYIKIKEVVVNKQEKTHILNVMTFQCN